MELFCAMQEMVAVSLLVIYFLGFVKNRRQKEISFAYV